jgi:DNA-binding NtrC family response regulator
VLARLCAISPKTKVIVITAREDLAARATAMAIGPVAFFMKPFDGEKFIAAVRDALNQARAKRLNRRQERKRRREFLFKHSANRRYSALVLCFLRFLLLNLYLNASIV